MKKISTLTGLLIIIATAIILFGGVFAWQKLNSKSETLNSNQNQKSNSETAGWKTYANDEYGLEMQYPASFEINEPSWQSTCSAGITESICEIIPFYNIVVAIVQHSFNEEIIWNKQRIKEYESGDGDSQNIVVDGKSANEYSFVTGLSYKVHGLQIPLNSNHFLKIEENSKVLILKDSDWQHIISTFKFTK